MFLVHYPPVEVPGRVAIVRTYVLYRVLPKYRLGYRLGSEINPGVSTWYYPCSGPRL